MNAPRQANPLTPLSELPHAERPLSTAARERRSSGLAPLQAEVVARGRRRKLAAGASAVTLLVAIAAGGVLLTQPPPTPVRPIEPAPVNPVIAETLPDSEPLAAAPPRSRLVRYVADRTESRHTIPASTGRVEVIGDRELLSALDTAGIRAGIARSDDRVRLAFHARTTSPSP